MNFEAKIEELVNQILAADDKGNELFVVDVKVSGSKRGSTQAVAKITILLDGDQGVDIDRCAQVSRRLGFQLEELNLLDSAYVLEISSPGLDTPLKLKRQYLKNIGRNVKVLVTDGSTKTGKLEAVYEDKILLTEEAKGKKKPGQQSTPATVEVPWKDIERTNVLVSFND